MDASEVTALQLSSMPGDMAHKQHSSCAIQNFTDRDTTDSGGLHFFHKLAHLKACVEAHLKVATPKIRLQVGNTSNVLKLHLVGGGGEE